MDDMLSRVVLRLCRIREQFGQSVFDDAALQALLAIARTVHREAEQRAKMPPAAENVIDFPRRDV